MLSSIIFSVTIVILLILQIIDGNIREKKYREAMEDLHIKITIIKTEKEKEE